MVHNCINDDSNESISKNIPKPRKNSREGNKLRRKSYENVTKSSIDKVAKQTNDENGEFSNDYDQVTSKSSNDKLREKKNNLIIKSGIKKLSKRSSQVSNFNER